MGSRALGQCNRKLFCIYSLTINSEICMMKPRQQMIRKIQRYFNNILGSLNIEKEMEYQLTEVAHREILFLMQALSWPMKSVAPVALPLYSDIFPKFKLGAQVTSYHSGTGKLTGNKCVCARACVHVYECVCVWVSMLQAATSQAPSDSVLYWRKWQSANGRRKGSHLFRWFHWTALLRPVPAHKGETPTDTLTDLEEIWSRLKHS